MNGEAMAAFMEGFQRTKALMDQQRLQRDELGMRREDRQQLLTRQSEQDRIAADARAQQAADRERAMALQSLQVPGNLAEIGGTATDPSEAQRLIESMMPAVLKAFGPEALAYGQPAVEMAQRTITARQKKDVERFVDQALKTSFIADNPDADPVITSLPEHIQRVIGKSEAKLSELQTFAQLPVGKPPGKTRVPAAAGSFEEYSDPSTPPERKAQIEADRKAYMQSDDRPRVTVNTGQGGYPPAQQRRIDAIVKGFDAQPTVKTIQKQAEAVSFAESLDPNTKNPADDQALIYAFAKAMDPDSVVREGEYATVQKYAQSWAESFGFNAARVFSNTQFLTPQARSNMKATIRAKYAAGRSQYDNLRNEYGRKIDRITGKSGTGVEELTDFGAAFPQTTSTPPPPPAATGTGPKVGERRKIKGVLAEWDGTGWLPVR